MYEKSPRVVIVNKRMEKMYVVKRGEFSVLRM
jgi:hypothetical protein